MGEWGSLLSGIGTILLALAAITAPLYFWRWRREKREEKMSLIAEEALNHLESSIIRVKAWIELASSFLVYSKNSPENISQYQAASKEEQEKLQRLYAEDLYEVGNYCRKFNAISDEFIIAKNRAARLGNTEIDRQFDELSQIMKKLPARLGRKHHPSLPTKEQIELTAFLAEEAPNQIDMIFEVIKKYLYNKLLLKK
jgi:hypothetical protein